MYVPTFFKNINLEINFINRFLKQNRVPILIYQLQI